MIHGTTRRPTTEEPHTAPSTLPTDPLTTPHVTAPPETNLTITQIERIQTNRRAALARRSDLAMQRLRQVPVYETTATPESQQEDVPPPPLPLHTHHRHSNRRSR